MREACLAVTFELDVNQFTRIVVIIICILSSSCDL